MGNDKTPHGSSDIFLSRQIGISQTLAVFNGFDGKMRTLKSQKENSGPQLVCRRKIAAAIHQTTVANNRFGKQNHYTQETGESILQSCRHIAIGSDVPAFTIRHETRSIQQKNGGEFLFISLAYW